MTYERTYGHLRRMMKDIITQVKDGVGEGKLWEHREHRDDEYGWELSVGDPSKREDGCCLGVTLMLADAAEYEGQERKGYGNVALSAIEYGGRILFEWVPNNYTDDVWVRLAPSGYGELIDRLHDFELSLPAAVERIKEWRKERGASND